MKGLISWFAGNPVAANMLMFVLIAGGLLSLSNSKLEIFPEISPPLINIAVAWPGATPQEVEEGVTVKIEEVIDGLEGIKRVTSTSSEHAAVISAHLFYDANKDDVIKEIERKVETITFPADVERPIVIDVKAPAVVMNVAVYGSATELELKRTAERVRDELGALKDVTRVSISNGREYEISIEVSESALRRYGLSFDQVASAVRSAALNLSAGTIKTRDGEILLRSSAQAYTGTEYERIPLVVRPDGTRILLGNVATVVDGFQDVDTATLFDDMPAFMLSVYRIGEQSAPTVSRAVRDYIATAQATMPQGVKLTVWNDYNDFLEGRLNLLIRNAQMGMLLVFIVLALFLRFKLAFWTTFGIPVSFLGTFWVMPGFDVTINMMTLFAFVLVLGIVVDDAIVVSENIYYHSQRGLKGIEAAKKGVLEVMVPVILACTTTMAAFYPMMNMPGTIGQFAKAIPIIVILTLVFSLAESLLVLPSHLSHIAKEGVPPRGVRGWWRRMNDLFADFIEHVVVKRWYQPSLGFALRWRYLTIALGVLVLATVVGLVGHGIIRFSFFPPVMGDTLIATLKMPADTPVAQTQAIVNRIGEAAQTLREELDAQFHTTGDEGSVYRHVMKSVGSQPKMIETTWERGDPSAYIKPYLGEVSIQLIPPESREHVSDVESMLNRWRALVGTVPDAEELKFTSAIMRTGDAINVELTSPDLEHLRAAALEVRTRLGRETGVRDVADSLKLGKQEIVLSVKPEAEALGVTQADLIRQVRQAFYGEEIQEVQRGRDEVKIFIRSTSEERRSFEALSDMRIRTRAGDELPLFSVAEVQYARELATIQRAELSRSVNITADVDRALRTPNEVASVLSGSILPEVIAHYPGMRYSFQGEQMEQADSMGGLRDGALLALLAIFTMLALIFRSYVQPLIVMTAIPFGMVGAILGHLLLGIDVTFLSLVGLLAMSGVAVNDSLVLVDFINTRRREGVPLLQAVSESGPRRFRAVMLTSLTTFVGLVPLIFERSVQAQFLIPMAVSLAFGVMFSTFITLIVVPSSYLIMEDLKALVRRRQTE